MVSPSASHAQRHHGAWALVSTIEFDAVTQFGVVHLGERLAAKVERGRGCGEQLIFGIGFLNFLDFGCGNIGGLGARGIVVAENVHHQMRKAYLIRRRFVTKFVGRHSRDRAKNIIPRARQQDAKRSCHRILHRRGSLRRCRRSGRRCCCSLRPSGSQTETCEEQRDKNAFHGKSPEHARAWPRARFAFYADQRNAAPIAAPTPVITTHQPKTIPYAVPRFTLLTQVKAIAVRTSVQSKKISRAEARL